ncbi:MAG: NAD-dependent deacylase [Actinobacteria bacterium]|nr:NAD-dependent deacylase [Actinomycetota bacterium]
MDALDRLADFVSRAGCVVALTGAGVSTASGIPDFRSPGSGLWSKVDPAQVASIEAFRDDPARFWSFYAQRFAGLVAAHPNAAHHALARMESIGRLHGVVTQNIDRLHAKAGTRLLAEVHGSVDRAECLSCGAAFPGSRLLASLAERPAVPPECDCGAPLKPGVVLFGEMLPEAEMDKAVAWARAADLMIVAGTSLQVWPVAGLPEITLEYGGAVAILNDSPTPLDDHAVVVDRSPVEESLPRLVESVEALG